MMLRISLALCATVLLSGCARATTPMNQQQNYVSPTGLYMVSVPIERADDGRKYWFVTIKNAAGEAQYKDEAKEFVANLNVYWTWDATDKLWLYSTDSGQVYVWINKDGIWEKHLWGLGKNNRIYKEAIQPPDELFPPYLKVT